MPILNILTNIAKEKVSIDAAKSLVDIVASHLGKPKQRVVVSIQPDQILSWAGDDKPAAVGRLVSIGGISPESNAKLQSAISECLHAQIGLPTDRLYICFEDFEPDNITGRSTK